MLFIQDVEEWFDCVVEELLSIQFVTKTGIERVIFVDENGNSETWSYGHDNNRYSTMYNKLRTILHDVVKNKQGYSKSKLCDLSQKIDIFVANGITSSENVVLNLYNVPLQQWSNRIKQFRREYLKESGVQ